MHSSEEKTKNMKNYRPSMGLSRALYILGIPVCTNLQRLSPAYLQSQFAAKKNQLEERNYSSSSTTAACKLRTTRDRARDSDLRLLHEAYQYLLKRRRAIENK
ncbi:uncharacterized protein LOC111713055 [Eurytemora carolleeae]|uniref:uncharacterized protein LOC111713055 n=1 Tax=Eurytemora carolleeae TaxID=1294199 RepID=UPI000C7888BF|nr:uncharacterized protein LOC111713055 [Eurytemora carolleeae]|eukprot:XP_023343613.1 uncharacterized protein LOC111713055 [Eurytemora affinis]